MPDDVNNTNELLTTYLSDRDVPCPRCQYNLRMLTGSQCPECGEKIAIGIFATQTRLAGFLFGLIGLTLSAGFSWSLIIYALLVGNLTLTKWVLAIGIPAVISSSLILLWIYARKWQKNRHWFFRWSMAALCWASPLINAMYFITIIDN